MEANGSAGPVGRHNSVEGGATRGQRVYDTWSSHARLYDMAMRLTEPLRDDAFDALAAARGETVLDLGCGPGQNFERLREAVGPAGRVVGLDYSPGMVQRARKLVSERGWSNVHVVRGDATDTCVEPSAFDAVLTTFALHTMEGADAVISNVYTALRPGGRFVALDSRAIQTWPAQLLNPLFERAIASLVNHQPDEEPLEAIRETFGSVEVVETYDAGSGYLVVAQSGGRDRS